jgi:hypothetical protein
MAKTKRTNNDLQNRKLKIEQHKPPPTILFGEGDDLVRSSWTRMGTRRVTLKLDIIYIYIYYILSSNKGIYV